MMKKLALSAALTCACVRANAQTAEQSAMTKEERNQAKQQAKEMRFDAAYFDQRSTLKDDDLEAVATITTLNGRQPFLGSDELLRAYVDKKTGQAEYQVYARTMHGGNWHFYSSVNLSTANGVVTMDAERVASNVSCSRYSCTYYEDAVFSLPENQVLLLAQAGEKPQGPVQYMNFKLKGSGGEYVGSLQTSEFAGLMRAIRRYRASHGLVQ